MKRINIIRAKAFSLIEMMMVLAIITVIATLLPQGLNLLYSRVSLDSVAHVMAAELRDCALRAQQHQRSLIAGGGKHSGDCRLDAPQGFQVDFESGAVPIFYADGTSNGGNIVVANSDSALTIQINRITSNVSVTTDASQ